MPPRATPSRDWLWLFLAIAGGVPALYIRLGFDHLTPEASALVFGIGIVCAAFLLSWGAEVAELDISQALALAFVALIAVLPEYAVDMYFAWMAGAHPEGFLDPKTGQLVDYTGFAAANMTGANRLLVGIGWPLVVILFWFKRRTAFRLDRSLSLELTFLAIATAYSFIIFFMREIAWWDSIVFISIFALYIWLSSRAEVEVPELVGPAAALGALARRLRRPITVLLFIYAGAVIVVSAEPFAEGLLGVGRRFDIDEFILVQWVAPLASESPEMLIAAIFTLRGKAAAAMTALISAKVNQWTLLVGMLPVVYSISLGSVSGLPLDARQTEEFLLTAAQSLFAITLLIRMRISWLGALSLFLLFGTQLFFTDPRIRYIYSYVYLGLSLALVVIDRGRVVELSRMARAVLGSAFGRAA